MRVLLRSILSLISLLMLLRILMKSFIRELMKHLGTSKERRCKEKWVEKCKNPTATWNMTKTHMAIEI